MPNRRTIRTDGYVIKMLRDGYIVTTLFYDKSCYTAHAPNGNVPDLFRIYNMFGSNNPIADVEKIIKTELRNRH